MEMEVINTPPLPALVATPPTRIRSYFLHFLMFLFGPLGRFILRKKVGDIRIKGIENLKRGPALVLMNHTNPFDPLLLNFFGQQPIHFFITETYMAKSFRARLMTFFGQITKRKLLNDTLPIRTMKQWAALGDLVALFPEGQFSWDGEMSPLQPGLRSLIQYLKLPVITVRLKGGHLIKPAWANQVRKGKIEIEIDAPKDYSLETEIEKDITQRLFVSTDASKPEPPFEEREKLAEGIATFFRFCPHCFSDHRLTENNNQLICDQCHQVWTVSFDLYLNNVQNPQLNLSIKSAWAKIRAHIETLLSKNHCFQSLASVTIYDASNLQWKFLRKGLLHYESQCLSIEDWNLEKSKILAFTLDWGDFILIRTERKRYALKMSGESRAIWEEVLRAI